MKIQRLMDRICRKNWITAVLAGCLGLSGCNNFLDVDPQHAAGEDQQWKTLEDTRAAIMGVYGLMRAALAENETWWLCGDLRGGDFSVYNRTDLECIRRNRLNVPHETLEEVANWRRFYQVVNAASVFIEKAPGVVNEDRTYSELTLKYDVAQARALRAFAYFCMVRIWGDVPLITDSWDNGAFPAVGRTDAGLVLDYARNELIEAVKDLPYVFSTTENKYYGNDEKFWRGKLLHKLSAYAILAHIAAWQGNYGDVLAYTDFILENFMQVGTDYTSVSDLTSSKGIFSVADETLRLRVLFGFTFSFADREATPTGHIETLTLAAPLVRKSWPEMYVSRDTLFSVFTEPNDLRFGIDTLTKTYNTAYIANINAEIPVFSKIRVVQDGAAVDNDYAVFGSGIIFTRLEEITLLRAEAWSALNQPLKAMEDLNLCRQNRGLAKLTFKYDMNEDPVKVVRAVFQERRKELMGEGWRWYDRIREQKLVGGDDGLQESIRTGGIYWPVAQEVLVANPLLWQTDYWNHVK